MHDNHRAGDTATGRKARLAAMVQSGGITPERAALINFREPSAAALAFAETLVPMVRGIHERRKRAAA